MDGTNLNISILRNIGPLTSLESLSLGSCNLEGTLPDQGEIPEHLAKSCINLRYLVLSNNSLEGQIFSDIMSNGIYKSPMHQVVTNTEKLRISVASFIEPDPDNEIGPVEHLIDEQRPRLYRDVKNYGIINYECYQKGLVALETVQV
ncbi:hypothetical protein Q3G72_034673 [Acer saccharum]|nr:hypothetical protein Q3G72_034673 [Acer saccharum]